VTLATQGFVPQQLPLVGDEGRELGDFILVVELFCLLTEDVGEGTGTEETNPPPDSARWMDAAKFPFATYISDEPQPVHEKRGEMTCHMPGRHPTA